MNASPKFKKRKPAISTKTPKHKRVYIGEWRLEEDDEGRLVVQHSSGEPFILAVPPK